MNAKDLVNHWRKFLNEGDMNDPGQFQDPDLPSPEGEPLEPDDDLLYNVDSDMDGEFEEYNEMDDLNV